MDISFKLNAFEGPLDLLLHLIEKNQVDIYDIPIAMITDQYLEYLSEMDKHDADITSDFLVMAATLLDIKARMLLPKDVDAEGHEEDPRAELVEKLIEYKTYKYMSLELKDKAITASHAMYKSSTIPEEVAKYEPPIDLDRFIGDVTISRLKAVFDDVLKRSTEKVNVEAMRYGRIQREAISIPDKIEEIRRYIADHETFSFRGLIEQQITRMNIIATFLAVLELMRTGEMWAEQEGNDTDIILHAGKAEVSDIGYEENESSD